MWKTWQYILVIIVKEQRHSHLVTVTSNKAQEIEYVIEDLMNPYVKVDLENLQSSGDTNQYLSVFSQ